MATATTTTSIGHTTGVEEPIPVRPEPHGVVHHLHPSTRPHTPSHATLPEVLTYYEDDHHPEYEFIRVPKNRDYDLYRVPRRQPEDRNVNKAQVPLTATTSDGTRATMWAKMDTGADLNLINQSTLEALLGDKAHQRMRSMTAKQMNLIGDSHVSAQHSVDLDFVAGLSHKQFTRVNFVVVADDPARSNSDGVPNVLLGLPFLQEHSMLMIDLDYCHDAEPGLPVLADKEENENPNGSGPLPVKLAQVKGQTRPKN